MAIKKLQEFARDGQKNTDNLSLTDGFSVTRKPARQWFNYLFNMLSLKINELVDLDPIARSDIINDLITNDSKKPLSAAMGKKLQDEKLDASKRGAVSGVASLDENKKVSITELHKASTTQQGIIQLVNDLNNGGIDKAITAEAVKQFKNAFKSSRSQNGYIEIPCADGVPLIIQWARANIPSYSSSVSGSLPVTFPNVVLRWAGSVTNGIAPTIFLDTLVTNSAFVFRSDKVLGAGAITCSFFAVGY